MFERLLAIVSMAWAASAAATDSEPRDPTAPERWTPAVAAVESGDLPVLSSVLISEQRKLVIIDGRLLGEGEQSGGIRVWQINPDHAVVSISGGSATRLWLDKHDLNKEVQ